jgi:sec-independent protein translocase protein TatB
MEFMGVGPAELLVILVVALVFVGPERLPRLAADIARTIREIRKYTGSIAAEFGEVVKDFEKDTAGDRSQWKDIGEGLTSATRSVTDALRSARMDAEPQAPALSLPPGASPAAPSSAAPASGTWRDIPEPTAARAGEPSTNGATAPPADVSR